MNILLIWKNDYPWDIRVEKISNSLVALGNNVYILARNTKNQNPEEIIDNVHIIRLKYFKNKFLNNIISAPIFCNPFWIFNTEKVCNKYNIELIIIRDLPLVYTGIYVGRKLGIPTIFDMAENYPAMWRDVINGAWYKPHNYIFKNPFLGNILERYCIKNVDQIMVVVEESKNRLLRLGISPKKISIVNNTPDMQKFNSPSSHKEKLVGKKVIFYEGFVNKGRGLDTIIRALPKLIEKFPDLYFVIVGSGKYISSLKVLSNILQVEKSVYFMGWVSFQEIPSLINASDICVIPHYNTEHKNTTIPNKLFDYMACKKPVIVSDVKPLKRIVEEEQCGLVFCSGNADDFARKVERAFGNYELLRKMGENGRKAVERRYNWLHDSLILKQVVDKFKK